MLYVSGTSDSLYVPRPALKLSPSANVPSTNSVSHSVLVEGVMLMEEMSCPLWLTSVTDTDTSFSPQPVSSSAHSAAASVTRSRFLIFFMIVLLI